MRNTNRGGNDAEWIVRKVLRIIKENICGCTRET